MTIYNFSAGPAVLPKEVLLQAQAELPEWRGSGMSVMEMSHRGKEYSGIHAQAEADLRELMGIPANYKVLFLQGGAHLQFSMIPLNLLRGKASADYVNTGEWSKKAIAEAKKFGGVNVVAESADKNFTYVPAFNTWKCDPNTAYLHYIANETIGGVEFNWTPDSGEVPLVADMSSNILSRQVEVSRFGLIYAGAQKNIGPAGLTLVIVRDDLIGQVAANTPTMLDYKIHADNDSMYNTPPTYGIYMAGLVFQWLKKNGGIAAMEKTNIAKAERLYAAIDASDGFYYCPVSKADRSRMNVPFTLKDANLDGEFLKQADARGLLQLKGHRSVGGMRASIYNAMPLSGVQALVDFMHEFAQKIMTDKLKQFRAQIDRIDDELLKLVNQRAALAQQIGHLKNSDTVLRPEREAQVLRRMQEANTGPLSNEAVAQLYVEIMSQSRALEALFSVAYLGPEGTFTEAAALKRFGSAIQGQSCATIDEVFRAVESGTTHYGVVPVENSTEGAIGRTLDLLLQSPLQVCGEVMLAIHQCLLARQRDLGAIKTIYSHSQSLGQCQGWLNANLPNVARIAVASNAEAARMASENAQSAAIAGIQAAAHFDLSVCVENIEDDANNTTRFLVLGKQQVAPSGKDKTSLVMSAANRPGAMHDLVVPFAKHGVSMTKLESRPARSGLWEYVFFVDIEGHRQDDKVAAALVELKQVAAFVKVLGSYPVAT